MVEQFAFSFPSLVNVELHIGESMIHRCYSFKAKKQISNVNLKIRIHLTKTIRKWTKNGRKTLLKVDLKENTISSDALAFQSTLICLANGTWGVFGGFLAFEKVSMW